MTNKVCFVLSPIKQEKSEMRKRADSFFKNIIVPVSKTYKFQPQRGDMIFEPGNIMGQVIRQIITAQIIVADLTDLNPNVFYELGISHIFRKKVILFIHEGDPVPFDIVTDRYINYNLDNADSIKKCKKQFSEHLKVCTNSNFAVGSSPINATIDILLSSGDMIDGQLGDFLKRMGKLQTAVQEIQSSDKAKQQTSLWNKLLR